MNIKDIELAKKCLEKVYNIMSAAPETQEIIEWKREAKALLEGQEVFIEDMKEEKKGA